MGEESKQQELRAKKIAENSAPWIIALSMNHVSKPGQIHSGQFLGLQSDS